MNATKTLLNVIDRQTRHELRAHAEWLRRMGFHDEASEIDDVLKRPLAEVLAWLVGVEAMENDPLVRLKLWLQTGLPDIDTFDDVVKQLTPEQAKEYDLFLMRHVEKYGSGYGVLDAKESNEKKTAANLFRAMEEWPKVEWEGVDPVEHVREMRGKPLPPHVLIAAQDDLLHEVNGKLRGSFPLKREPTRLELQARGELGEIEAGDWVAGRSSDFIWQVENVCHDGWGVRYLVRDALGLMPAWNTSVWPNGDLRLATPEELAAFGIISLKEASDE